MNRVGVCSANTLQRCRQQAGAALPWQARATPSCFLLGNEVTTHRLILSRAEHRLISRRHWAAPASAAPAPTPASARSGGRAGDVQEMLHLEHSVGVYLHLR